jgi:hypothetical protein
MKRSFRPQLTYSNVIASVALFIALGGAAVAAGLPKHSVGAKQLKRGAVTAAALKKGAVTSGKLAPKSVVNGKIGPNAISPGNIGNGAVTTAKLAAGSVVASTIKNSVITNPKLANEVVTTTKLANGSVTPAKLSAEIGGTVSTLKSGQTLRGVFDVGGTNQSTTVASTANGAASFSLPLVNPAAVTILKKGEKTANCGGLSGGNEQTPQATAGNLCIYLTTETNLDATTPLSAENNTRLGFGLVAKSLASEGPYAASGQWAVTAP